MHTQVLRELSHDTVADPHVHAGSSPAAAPKAVRRSGRIGLFAIGIAVTAVGVAAMLRAGLGTGPADVMIGAMAAQIGVSHGTATQATQAAFIVVAMALGRLPGPGTLASALVLGPAINVAMLVIDVPGSIMLRGLMAALGLLATGVGVGLFIAARFGPSTGELWSDAVSSRLGTSKQGVRLALETTLAALGFIFGGPIGLLTVAFVLAIGPLVELGTSLGATATGATRRQWERSTRRLSRL